jgi:ketosteroid isomerase-like protein
MKRSSISLILCLAGAVTIFAGCGTAHAPSPAAVDTRAQDEADIRAAVQGWGKAIENKNLDQTLSYYADDAWVYPQGAPAATTADERRSVWTAFFATPGASDMGGDITRIEIARSGDLAVQYGTFAMSVNDKNGKQVTQNEKSVVVWKKQLDGKWKAIADIWNTDK